MSDEAALQTAILANPDDDTPRLAYADWLDEHGDAAARDRAEFIRLQIEAARGAITDTRRNAIARRCKALEKTHGKDWRAPFVAACGKEVVAAVFRRGFISDIFGGVRLPSRFPAIAKVCPVQRVDIDFDWITNTSRDSPGMGKCKALERLRWMECRRFPAHFGKAVLASPHLTGLRTLYLQWGWLEKGVELVSRSPVARKLRHLWVWGASEGQITPGGGFGVITEAEWPSLTQVRLDNLALGPTGVTAVLRAAVERGWHAIHIHDRQLNRARAIAALKLVLAGKTRSASLGEDCTLDEPPEPVPDDVRLLRLYGFWNDGEEIVRWVIENVPPGRFNRLELSFCNLGGPTVRALAKWPGLAQITHLDLRVNHIGATGATALAASPHLENVNLLRVAHNGLGEKAKAALKKRFARRVRVTDV